KVSALTLRDRGEIDLAIGQREFRGSAEDRRRRFLEDRIFLVLHRYLSWSWKKRIRPVEGDAAEVVIDGVIGAAGERNTINEKALRIRPDLYCAEHQRSAFPAALRLGSHSDVIHRFGPLGRADVLRRCGVNRVVGRISSNGEPVRCKRLRRREYQELITNSVRAWLGDAQLEVRI